MRGTAANDTIVGTTWNDTIIGNSGNDSLTGGAGNDVFVFDPGFGKDTITDFTAGVGSVDAIEFADDVFADFAAVLAVASQVGADTLITADVNNTITLKNIALANLHQEDFQFVG
ncbi:hypothetical protein OHD58_24720 [Mesorhizobium sp. ZC-5]|nr:hypothetical protein [Mesorhizobium sp. ZC-5]MCV3243103.1 hypothetical protein [Mesorhizobium sp. ZC-5]